MTVGLMRSCLPEHTSSRCTAQYKAKYQVIISELHMQHSKIIDRSAMSMIVCSPLHHEMQLARKALACITADHVTWKTLPLEGCPAAHTSLAPGREAPDLSCARFNIAANITNMFTDELFTDARVVVEGRVWHVHRAMLASASPILKDAFLCGEHMTPTALCHMHNVVFPW